MTLKQYLIIMLLATVFCWVAWWFVITNVDPFQADVMGFIFFYASLFCSLVGTVSILSFLFRSFFFRSGEPMFRYVKRSFRDALFIAIFLILSLYFQSRNYLHWWNAGVLAAAFLLYIIFTWSTKKYETDETFH